MIRRLARRVAVALVAAIMTAPHPVQGAGPSVPLDVQFKLADLDYKPIAGARVRLVFGDEPWRQPATAGLGFATDAAGEARLTTSVVLDKRMHKVPTNFVDSLLSLPKETDHLVVGVDLEYLTFRWLYIVELFRFPKGGDVLFEGFAIYNRDAQGRFSRKASYDGRAWRMPDLNGMMLTTAGHEVYDFALKPTDGTANAWTLTLAFKKYPEPVRR